MSLIVSTVLLDRAASDDQPDDEMGFRNQTGYRCRCASRPGTTGASSIIELPEKHELNGQMT